MFKKLGQVKIMYRTCPNSGSGFNFKNVTLVPNFEIVVEVFASNLNDFHSLLVIRDLASSHSEIWAHFGTVYELSLPRFWSLGVGFN